MFDRNCLEQNRLKQKICSCLNFSAISLVKIRTDIFCQFIRTIISTYLQVLQLQHNVCSVPTHAQKAQLKVELPNGKKIDGIIKRRSILYDFAWWYKTRFVHMLELFYQARQAKRHGLLKAFRRGRESITMMRLNFGGFSPSL